MERVRPIMLDSLDEKAKSFFMILRRKRGVETPVVSVAVGQALMEKSTYEYLKWINLISITWTQSVFRRMGFARRMRSTDKLEIPDWAVMEVKLLFQHQIASLVEEHNILPSLIMKFDQTPRNNGSVSNSTLAKKRPEHVSIAGGVFIESITASFGITYSNKFLPMKLISRKNKKKFCISRFPTIFSAKY